MTRNQITPAQIEEEAAAFVAWIKAFCRTIEDAQKSMPSHAGRDFVCQVGGWAIPAEKRLKPGEFVVRTENEFRIFKLKDWWNE